MKKRTYHGLITQRFTIVQEAIMATASVQQNKLKVNSNNGWEHDAGDEITIENNQFKLSFQ